MFFVKIGNLTTQILDSITSFLRDLLVVVSIPLHCFYQISESFALFSYFFQSYLCIYTAYGSHRVIFTTEMHTVVIKITNYILHKCKKKYVVRNTERTRENSNHVEGLLLGRHLNSNIFFPQLEKHYNLTFQSYFQVNQQIEIEKSIFDVRMALFQKVPYALQQKPRLLFFKMISKGAEASIRIYFSIKWKF